MVHKNSGQLREIAMTAFQRSDGVCLQVVPGFRERILSYRPSVTPQENWTVADYEAAATRKRRRFSQLLAQCKQQISLKAACVLDVGCGDGANSVQFALEPIQEVIGIDLSLPWSFNDAKGQRTRALANAILRGRRTPQAARFLVMDATRIQFKDAHFDLVVSRSAMEHIKPIEEALSEIARVTKPGGLIYLGIDPFYWVRGCHKRGVVDIPFAHARLTLNEYTTFVESREGATVAARRRQRLETLNRFTLYEWRARIEAIPCEVLSWHVRDSAIGRTVLSECPEIPVSLRSEISLDDLLCERIEVWLRRT